MNIKEEFMDEISAVNDELKRIMPREPKDTFGMIEEYVFRGGKRVRPVISIITTKALGGDWRKAIKLGAIIELFHNFTLIHDDIEDSSELRRGKPTLHKLYGIPIALNSGDALYTYVWQKVVEECDKELAKKFGETFMRVVEGQGYELYLERNEIFDLKEENYFYLAERKTGALIGLSFAIASYLSNKKEIWSELYNFGKTFGVAFQIQDDILNLTGDIKKYKKKIGDDITEGKRTLLVIYALNHLEGKDADRLKEILKMHTDDEKLISEAIELINKSGAIEYGRNKAYGMINEAIDRIRGILPDNEYSKKIIDMVDYFVKREE